MTHPVFFDPSGRRRRVINHATLVLGVTTGLLAVLFIVSLLAAPFVQRPGAAVQANRLRSRTAGSLLAPRRARVSRHLVQQARAELAREISATRPGPGRAAVRMSDDSIVAAFYVVWQGQNGINDFREHAEQITHVIPEWLHLSRDGAGLDQRDFDTLVVRGNAEVMRIATEHGIDILPILNNAENRVFDPRRAGLMLGEPARRRAVALAVRDFVAVHGFDGVNVDFENLAPHDYERLPAFLAELKAALPDTLTVSVDIEAGLPAPLVARLAKAADFVVLMAYAQHGPANEPGPLAALPWFDEVLARFEPVIPPGKLVAGIGNYGLDWTRGAGGVATTVVGSWVVARDRRADGRPQDVVDFDAAALNPTFVYRDDSTRAHEVWFLDAVTAYNQLRLAQRHGAAGAALWVLGAEDPSLWTLFDRRLKGSLPPPVRLDRIGEPGSVNYVGDGEILSIAGYPSAGTRQTDLDSATGLLTDERYLSFPASFVIKREGYQQGVLALTFDDGPDDRWTDEVLDTLNALGVKGTFFLVGQNVERYPDVVRRIVAAGHEVGNHTFTHPNMATVRRRQAVLELNATQRAIEAVTGRSTILFRVPYNTDAEPQHGGETTPLTVASDLGYVTVGELLDPMDWNLFAATGDQRGQPVRRTPRQLADDIIAQARTVRGNVILLHSAGGDRSLTVRALALAVPELEASGYRFVTVSQLLGLTRDAVMPPVSARDQVLVGSDRITFEILDLTETVLTNGFVAALILALLRLLVVVPLALAARRRTARRPAPSGTPPVSVLIAAYNEAPVIEQTIRSILASDYPDFEVVVVDDGSTDGTADIIRTAFAAEARVFLYVQANGGKSAALNLAMAECRHEVLVCFDADTVAEPDTIALLARHFSDPSLAAVAGNVKVGNRINTLTIWQSIEYITSQNLDRRAWASLNAVTVVPGAVGAWRRSMVLKVGGYVSDTLAEDMDLTMRLRRGGWRIDADASSVAWTEAPETWEPFLRQRYRWAYGSLQVLWKHRGALGRYGWFGRLVLPAQWLFGVLFQILGPLVDLRLLYAILAVAVAAINGAARHLDWQPQLTHLLMQTGFFYAVFFAVDLAASLAAFRLDREDMKQLWWLFWQRFAYRQTMYYVLWKAVVGAVKGKRFGWGKGLRTGTMAAISVKGEA